MTSYRIVRHDLSVTNAAPGAEIPIGAPSFVVRRLDAPARVRIGAMNADPIGLAPGRYCSRTGSIDRIWIENDAVEGAIVEILVEHSVAADANGSDTFEGLYENVPTTVADGQRKRILIDAQGRPIVRLGDRLDALQDSITIVPPTGANATENQGAGAIGAPPVGKPVLMGGVDSNGNVAVAPIAENRQITVLASAVRNATNNSPDLTNVNGRGVVVFVNVTAIAGGSITVKIQGKDTLSGQYYDILTSAALDAPGFVALRVAPGITTAENVAVADLLPRTWRVRCEHATADNVTYSVSATVVL